MHHASNSRLQTLRYTTADRETSHRGQRMWNTSAGRAAVTCTCHIALALAARCPSVLADGDITAVNFRGTPVALGRWSRERRSVRVDGFAGVNETPPRASPGSHVVASSRHGLGSFGAVDWVMRRDYVPAEIPMIRGGWGRYSEYSVDARALELCRGGAFESNYEDENGETEGEDSGYDDTGYDDGDSDDSGSSENYDTDEGVLAASEGSDDNNYGYSQQQHQDEVYDGDDEHDFTTDAELERGEDGDGEDGHAEGTEVAAATVDEIDHSVRVCVLTWNLAEESPPASDVAFLRRAAEGCDLVGIGVQEIENLKPRRNEGRRTREWRRLLLRTLGKDFIRVGHQAMGAVQLTLFARRALVDRVKVIKLTEVACGVGNVLQNKGGIGAFVRVDRTTFLFIAAHLAAHQDKVEERNADYWRIVSTLEQEIPPAWVTHATRKRAKRLKAEHATTTEAAQSAFATSQSLLHESSSAASKPPSTATSAFVRRDASGREGGDAVRTVITSPPGGVGKSNHPRGPFQDRVDRVFFFGDLNYRVDLSREDIEMGISVARRHEGRGGAAGWRGWKGGQSLGDILYPGTGALDPLLDFDQLTRSRSQGKSFGGFSEGRVGFEPTYKYNKGSGKLDTSRKMRPPAWTDRILFSPGGPSGVSLLEYRSEPGSRHSDHRPVYATFSVRLED